MLNKRTLLITLGVSSAAVAALLNLYAARSRRADARTQRRAVQRWEGEGGHVLDPAAAPAREGDPAPEGTA